MFLNVSCESCQEKLHRAIHELRLVSIISKWMKNSFMRNTNYYLLQLSGGREHFGKLYFFSGTMFIQILRLFAVFVPCDNRWAPFFSTTSIPAVFSRGFFFLLFLQCCTVSWSCVLFFGWRSQLDLWEGWVSYCLSCCVLMECRNLYASFHSSFIAIDFWLSPLPVLKGDVATEKMSVSQWTKDFLCPKREAMKN